MLGIVNDVHCVLLRGPLPKSIVANQIATKLGKYAGI